MFDPNSYGNISDRIDFEIMKNDKEIKRRMGRWEEGDDDDDDEMEFEEEKQPEEDWSSEEEDQDSSQDSYVSSEE